MCVALIAVGAGALLLFVIVGTAIVLFKEAPKEDEPFGPVVFAGLKAILVAAVLAMVADSFAKMAPPGFLIAMSALMVVVGFYHLVARRHTMSG